ncbi:MAG: BatA domain-containing protein [Pirellulaceae bacterium]
MQFVHPSLIWGFWLALLPVLIHLINLVRRRRIQWAAMDFLLQSHRKHRKWIWMTQLLLLLMRMAAIALLVIMVAQWVARRQWLSLFGGASTHHYILLDDSYSMSERFGNATGWDRAKQILGQIGSQAISRETQQKFTVLRFSRASGVRAAGDMGAVMEQVADFNAETVDAEFDIRLEERRRQMEVTQLAVGPRPALELLNQLLQQGRDETNVVYLLSDFRENQWEYPAELRRLLKETEQHSEAIHFVRCSRGSQTNLTVTELRPGDDTRAAGVPLFMYISVKNNGRTVARRVPIHVRASFFDPQAVASSEPGKLQGRVNELPTVLVEEIPPGETVTRRVQVFFPLAGAHVVEAGLDEDPVAIDNRRWHVLDLPDGEPALVIDGSLTRQHAYYLTAAFEPGKRANSGVRPELRRLEFLRDANPAALHRYAAIYLLDVRQLDDRSLENLESYLRNGGGVALFLGEQTNISYYNERMYRGGEGLFPLPLERDDLLPSEMLENTPDIEVADHPMFRIFRGERNPFLRLVTIERYFRPARDWRPDPDSTVSVISTLRNQSPLVVERQFGRGRVVAFLTTLAPDWNNWAHDPSFVVMLLRLHAHLSAAGQQQPERFVGMPIEVKLGAERYRKDVVLVAPGAMPNRPNTFEVTAVKSTDDARLAVASIGGPGTATTRRGDTLRGGIYEVWRATIEGTLETRRFALNVDADEGDLTLASASELRAKLEPIEFTLREADDYTADVHEQSGFNRSMLVLTVLVMLLLGEQLLAYFASYHPKR